MTVIELARDTRDTELSDEEKRVRARADWCADPDNVTGPVLGDRYGMSEEWGRKQIRAARRERDVTVTTARPTVTPVSPPETVSVTPVRHDGKPRPLPANVTEADAERFWANVDKRFGNRGCWLWNGAYGRDYGAFNLAVGPGERRTVRAHRLAYELGVGPIPDGLTLDHLCRNTACVNPSHLEPVTNEENVRRMHEHRARERGRRRDLVKDVGVVVVAAVMLAVSYNHIVHLALLAGCGWWAWVMPLPLDGMAVVSIRHLRQERRYWVAWAGIIIGLGGSLVANVVAFDPTLAEMRHVGWAFAALPPLAVAVCLHLFDRGNRGDR